MRADNDGEGGILALLALVPARLRDGGRWGTALLAAAVHLRRRAALRRRHHHAGDLGALRRRRARGRRPRAERASSCPSPAASWSRCSPSSAAAPPASAASSARSCSSGSSTMALLGARFIALHPEVLRALSPTYAVAFGAAQRRHHLRRPRLGGPRHHRRRGALRRHGPLRRAADPHLVVRARDAGARRELLRPGRAAAARPGARRATRSSPWCRAGALTYLLVALSATATVIASQALISGAFSLTRQAIQLGYLPRFEIRHTSSAAEGQIYIWRGRTGCSPPPAWPGARVRRLDAPRRRVRHRGDRHDGHHQRRLLRRAARGLEVAAVAGAAAVAALFDDRSHLLRLEPAQVRRRRLRADPRGDRRVRHHDRVAARPHGARAPHRRRCARRRRPFSPRPSATASPARPAPASSSRRTSAACRRRWCSIAATCTRCPRASSSCAWCSSACRACRSATASTSPPRRPASIASRCAPASWSGRACPIACATPRPRASSGWRRPTSPTSSAARPSSRPTRARWAAPPSRSSASCTTSLRARRATSACRPSRSWSSACTSIL